MTSHDTLLNCYKITITYSICEGKLFQHEFVIMWKKLAMEINDQFLRKEERLLVSKLLEPGEMVLAKSCAL